MDEQYKTDLQDKIKATKERLLAMQAFAEGKPVWWNNAPHGWVKADPADVTLSFNPDLEYRATSPNLKLELELTPATALVLLALLNTGEGAARQLIKLWPEYAAHVEVPDDTGYDALWKPEDSPAHKLQKYLDEVVQTKGE